MAAQLYNNVTDQLSSSVSAAATQINVVNGSKFTNPPTGDYFPLYIIASNGAHEIVHVTSVSGNTLTVERAQEGTDPLVFVGNETVQIRPTRQSLRELEQIVNSSTGSQSVSESLDSRVVFAESIDDLDGLTPSASEGQRVATELEGQYKFIMGQWERVGGDNVTVRIPTDYPDWQAAFDAYSTASMFSDKRITLLIESGHVIPRGLYISGGDYSYIKITSEDDVVQITSDFEGVFTQQVVSGSTIPRAMVVDGGSSPILEIAVSGLNYRVPDTTSHPRPFVRLGGLFAAYGSTVVFTGGSGLYGFRDFTGQGLYCRGARFIGQNTVFTNSGEHGAQMTGGSYYYIATSNFSDAWWNTDPYGPGAQNLTDAGISTSRGSSGSAQSVIVNDCGRTGVDIRRGFCLYNNAEVLRSAGQSNLCVRNGGIAFANSINLGLDGVVELRPGGGMVFLGSGATYGSIRTFSPPRTWQANVLTPYGVVFDEDAAGLGDNLIELSGDEFEGYRLYSSGYCETWKYFRINENGDVNFDNYVTSISAPIRLKSQNPNANNDSAASMVYSGVTFRQSGSLDTVDLLRVQSRFIASYTPQGGGRWVLRHPWTGQQTTVPVEGVLWANGYIV